MARTLLDRGSRDGYCSRAVCGSNSAVECHLAKVDVAGSNPVSRSRCRAVGRSRRWWRQRGPGFVLGHDTAEHFAVAREQRRSFCGETEIRAPFKRNSMARS